MEAAIRLTPFWEQYRRLKAQHPDALLWTRVGDFYEMFEEDARTAARELHITLTAREFGKDLRVPLAGVPYHAAESYLARLIRKGYHVAICEQMSEPGRGLVEREVVRVVTPGTLAEPGLLPRRANNYLAAALWREEAGALAYVDVSTGEFAVAQFDGPDAAGAFEAELRRLAPAECLVPREQSEPCPLPGHRTTLDPWQFDEDTAREHLLRHFRAQSLAAFGCEGLPLAITCAGAVLRYISRTNPALLPAVASLRGYRPGAYMQLDGQTRQNLNLLRGAHGGPEGSLLEALDRTQTAIGARLLRRWLGQPLLDLAQIRSRQEVVATLVGRPELRGHLRRLLGPVHDVERTTGRIRSGGATAREVWGLHASLQAAEALQRLRRGLGPPLDGLLAELDTCSDVAALIGTALAEPGAGQTIAAGHSAELDARRDGAAGDRAWMADLEARERARTGIKSLKVAVNKVFGYYIEVTNPNRKLVPADYARKQTVAGAERYVTPELKEVESRLLRAADDIEALEAALFADLLRRLGAEGERLLETARRLAELDVLCALAEVADLRRWTRPALDESATLAIVNGRHPVVEDAVGADAFIPNDCHLSEEGPRLLLITGPNMAGKSTYLRQVALIALLAQMGSFVPADEARLGLVDRIFTRVGASDDLAGGASTFMVEMMETAAICRQATARSLIVLDEVGRGTSTEDGGAIARAVLEHLHDAVGARTLFATHFRELAEAAPALPGLEAWTFAVLELSGQLAFTHRLTPGVAERSYGLHVARLAGLPEPILARAQALLERGAAELAAPLALPVPGGRFPDPPEPQAVRPVPATAGDGVPASLPPALITDRGVAPAAPSRPVVAAPDGAAAAGSVAPADADDLVRRLCRLDLAQTTPLQALLALAEAQQAARRLLTR